jgi:nucleotide-binding universal stress UspA family protein
MNTVRSLLAAVDFSDDSRLAAHRAAVLAAEQRAKLDLLHVISGQSLSSLREMFRSSDAEADIMADARRMLNELAADIAGKTGVTAISHVTVGNVLEKILSASEQADILVLGAHGLNPLRDRILGTTAVRLLGKCTLPVLVINRQPQGAYKRVLVPVDFSAHSTAALNMALRVAPGAGVKIVHAIRVPFEEKLGIAGVRAEEVQKIRMNAQLQAVRDIEALIQEIGVGQDRIVHAVEHGRAASFILTEAAGFAADLIVIGKHGRSMPESMLLGSVTRRVLSHSKCDVLVVHEGRTAVAND